jgi:hypothetical protein
MWERLTPDGHQVIRLAYLEARELRHPCLADEHVLVTVHSTRSAATIMSWVAAGQRDSSGRR